MIIGFCNLKGGVGKTTSCQNIAVALTKAGKRLAVVDMDPQSNLSAGFGIRPSKTDPQVFDLLSGAAGWEDVITRKENIDVVPSSLNLVMAELNDDGPVNRKDALSNALAKVDADRYDYILLDSPPQLGIFTQNVLSACNKIIVPMDGGFYSLYGLRLLDHSMGVFRKKLNPELEIGGILMTNYSPRLYLARKIHDEVRKSFGDLLFENFIKQNVSLVEASSMGLSIFAYAPKSTGAECYRIVAQEFLRKFEEKPKQKPEPPKTGPIPPVEPPKTTDDGGDNPVPPPPPQPHDVSPKSPYVQGIIDDVLDMLPDSEKEMWAQLLEPIDDISRGEIDVRSLRDDFEDSDKDRFTFYVLNDEANTFWPVMYPDQIIEPLKCVMKWDENGAVEVYM